MNALKENKNLPVILLVVITVTFAFIIYSLFFRPDPNAGLAEGGLFSEPGEFGETDGGPGVMSGADVDLIIMLGQLSDISLENRLESKPGFAELSDRSVSIETREPGRDNPFAPYAGKPVLSSQ